MSRRVATSGEPNPHHEQAKAHAAAELERRLRPWLPDSLRQGFAERFIEDLSTKHWRYIPPPINWRASNQPADPDTARRRVAEIRQSLRQPPAKGHDDQERERR